MRFNRRLIYQVSKEKCIKYFVWLKFYFGYNFINFESLCEFVAYIKLVVFKRGNAINN